MRQRLMRPVALAFLAIALTLSAPLITEQATAFAQASGELHHPVSQQRKTISRRPVRRGAIGAGGAGLYNVRAKRGKTVRKVGPIKKKTVFDDTDIVQ